MLNCPLQSNRLLPRHDPACHDTVVSLICEPMRLLGEALEQQRHHGERNMRMDAVPPVTRYIFIAVDLHHLLLAGLPAHPTLKRRPTDDLASSHRG